MALVRMGLRVAMHKFNVGDAAYWDGSGIPDVGGYAQDVTIESVEAAYSPAGTWCYSFRYLVAGSIEGRHARHVAGRHLAIKD